MSTTEFPPKIGKYQVLSILGRGGMGVVYRARDPHIEREVAIKTIHVDNEDPALLARLKTEARSAGRLDHPSIVTVYDFGEEHASAYIVMELVEGLNLARVIETQRPMSLGRKIDIIIQVCQGLAYAHELGVIHRDIKPANICVTSKGAAKVLDFGLAYAGAARVTKTGMMSGTIAYMSPERLRGVSGPPGDIFAIGVVAYELFTYRRAYVGDIAEVMTRILSGESPVPPSEVGDVPAELDPVVMKAVAVDPHQRYPTAAAFAEALASFRASPAFRDFISDKRRTDELERQMASFVDSQPSSANPYSAPTGGDQSEAPTVQVEQTVATEQRPEPRADHTAHSQPTMVTSPIPGLETLPSGPIPVVPASEKAEAKPGIRDRRATLGLGIAAALVVVAAIVLVGRRDGDGPGPNPPPTTTQTQTQTTPTIPPARTREFELQQELLRSLAQEVSTIQMTSEQRTKFVEAQTYGRLAERRFEQNDSEGGTKLMSSAIQMMRDILTAGEAPVPGKAEPADPAALGEWQRIQISIRELVATAARNDVVLPARQRGSLDRRLEQLRTRAGSASADLIRAEGELLLRDYRSALDAVAAQRREADRQRQERLKKEQEAATQTVEKPLPPPTQTTVTTPERPPRPTAEELRREVSDFIRAMAVAYQNKDVEFFRRNSLRFSADLERAIRNSPSVRVEFSILSVELDNTAARVTVRRTDTFGDRDVPPGVQTLIYTLRRDAQGWKIADLRRAG
jgi:serine/threonine protein kinase